MVQQVFFFLIFPVKGARVTSNFKINLDPYPRTRPLPPSPHIHRHVSLVLYWLIRTRWNLSGRVVGNQNLL